MATYTTLLDYAYKRESDANVRERILLVRRIIFDGQDMVLVSKEETSQVESLGVEMVQKI